MANNRMFLVNKRTGRSVLLAKYYPSTGWFTPENIVERLMGAFRDVDFGHLTGAQIAENMAAEGFKTPHKAYGDMYGDEWTVVYETQPSTPSQSAMTDEEIEDLAEKHGHGCRLEGGFIWFNGNLTAFAKDLLRR